MSYLELLWIPAVLGWIPLIYADEISALLGSTPEAVEKGEDLARTEPPSTL